LTFISLLRVFQNESCRVQFEQPQCAHSTCILTRGRDWTWLLDSGQSCSKLSVDDFRPSGTCRHRTIQDSSRTFQQALYASFS
jgi:hypothetical protein